MAKVDTNAIALNFAREAIAGTKAAAGWKRLEPNEISQFGAAITTVARAAVRSLPVASVDDSADKYVLIDNLVAGQNAKLKDGALVWAYGFSDTPNNGLKRIDTDTAADKDVAVDESLTAAAGGTAAKPAGYVALAGYRVPSTTDKTWSWDAAAKTATLALASNLETDDLDDELR